MIANVIDARARDLGGVAVRRVLPAAARRMVGPFTFLDDMNGGFAMGEGLDVPPHPHIGLATVTYLSRERSRCLWPTKKLSPRSIIIQVRACPSAIKKVYASGFSRARRSA